MYMCVHLPSQPPKQAYREAGPTLTVENEVNESFLNISVTFTICKHFLLLFQAHVHTEKKKNLSVTKIVQLPTEQPFTWCCYCLSFNKLHSHKKLLEWFDKWLHVERIISIWTLCFQFWSSTLVKQCNKVL